MRKSKRVILLMLLCAAVFSCCQSCAGSAGAAEAKPSPTGKTVLRYTRTIADAYQNITLDRFVIMPNLVHLLLTIHPALRLRKS